MNAKTSFIADDTRFENFDLSIHLGPNNTPWISASSRIGLLHGIPRNGPSIPRLDDLLDLVHDYRDSVQFAENAGLTELSEALRTLVFGEPQVLELFQATRGAAADRGRQTIVRVLASPHLATLPWELLPDPAAGFGRNGRNGYLTLASDAHIVRMARGRSYATRNRPLKLPLNLLIVLSSPGPKTVQDELLAFDIYEVKRSLLSELEPLIESGILNVHIEDRPTLENLRRCIGRVSNGYHLFHYVGHALPDQLVLEDLAGRRRDHDSTHVCEILRMCPELRLAVFAGCETARAHTEAADLDARLAVGWRDLISMADRCVQEACPLVIGMQAVLPFRTERLFTRFFYQGIASGYSVVEALQLARGAARSDSRLSTELLDWSVPALFIGSGDPGPLIDRSARRELKIGLRQGETRFFARDLALRQAVDVLGWRTPERVLIVTGAAGVGKTYLIDRALEEVGATASHVLYVKMSRLVPALETSLQLLRAGEASWAQALRDLEENSARETCCKLMWDVLRQGAPESLGPDRKLSSEDQWDQLVEAVNRVRFILAIDEFELFDEFMDACMTRWLTPIVASMNLPMADLASLLELVRSNASATRSRSQANFDQIAKALTKGTWQLSPWLYACMEHALEPLLLATLEATTSVRNTPTVKTSRDSAESIRALAQKVDRCRTRLEEGLRSMVQRRTGPRAAIITTSPRANFLGVRHDERLEMRLAHLTWQETWRWVRRNLPGLLRYGEAELQRVWGHLGPELEPWENLEREVLSHIRERPTLDKLVTAVTPPTRPIARSANLTSQRRGTRPLRLAIAGPHIRSAAALAHAITRIANENGVGGRISSGARAMPAALGEIVDLPSPFTNSDGYASDEAVDLWLHLALERRPDIVLLDYGQYFSPDDYKLRETKHRTLFECWQHRTLFIAAGDNSGLSGVSEPGIFPEVTTVGAADRHCTIRPYSPWRPEFQKPDFYMPDALEDSPLFEALSVNKRERTEGTSFAALHAAVTASLVWSLLPELQPHELRRLLMSAGLSDEPTGEGPRVLTIQAALRIARARLVTDTLRAGSCSRETLAAITGQDHMYLQQILDEMVVFEQIRRVVSGRLERFELMGADTRAR